MPNSAYAAKKSRCKYGHPVIPTWLDCLWHEFCSAVVLTRALGAATVSSNMGLSKLESYRSACFYVDTVEYVHVEGSSQGQVEAFPQDS